jgi:ABC-type transport system substrate-binding protein
MAAVNFYPSKKGDGKMQNRSFITTTAVVFCLVVIVGFAGTTAQAGKADNTLVFGQSIPVTDLGPAYMAFLRYPAGYEVGFVLYDRLVTFDDELNFKPQLAESWEISADQKQMIFKLRQGVKFHDGTPFNAEAVKFNIERMMDVKRNSTNRPLWSPIAGAEVIDTYTVAINTKEPFALLLNTLAHGSGAMVSPTAIWKNGDESMTLKPVGAGPFMLDSFKPGQEVTVKAFPDYWAGKPKLEKIVFKYIPEAPTRISALKTGSVDVIDAIPSHMVSGLKKSPNLQVLSKPGLRPMGLAILTTREPYTDIRVRKALNYAVPVKTIADRIFFGYAKASDSPLAFNTVGHKAIGGYEFDPEKAKALLAEAGFKGTNSEGIVERSGKPFKLTLLTSEGQFPGDIQVAEISAKAFQEIGIDVRITKIEKGSYWDALRLKQSDIKWDLAVFGFNPSNGGGVYHLDSMFHSNPDDASRPRAWNIVRFRDAKADALIEEAKTTVDPKKRATILGQAQEIIWDEAPYVWLHVPEIISAAHKDVKGVEVWPIIFTIVRNAHF